MKKISRRDFLKASAATSGAALLTACGSSGSSTVFHCNINVALAQSGPRTVSYWIDLANTSGADVKSMGDLYCWKAIEANTGINVRIPASGQWSGC